MQALAAGRIAGKVMVVPGADGTSEGRGLMAHPYYPTGNPRFNHVAMSVPAALLDESNRTDICGFWGKVLGFDEMPMMTIDRKRLILSCVHWDQFIFLIAEDDPMRCPRMDHFGFAVGSLDELVGVRDRAVAFQKEDPRVDLIDLARGRPGADQDPLDLSRLHPAHVVRAPVLGVRAHLIAPGRGGPARHAAQKRGRAGNLRPPPRHRPRMRPVRRWAALNRTSRTGDLDIVATPRP